MIDSHCHLESRQFDGRRDEVIANAREAGVNTIVNIGTDLPTSHESVSLAEQYEDVYATVGVHPHSAKEYSPEVETALERALEHPRVVALGEIGLDFYRDLSPRPIQREVFRKQLALAARKRVPVVIHVRESFEESFAIIKDYVDLLPSVVFHCFSEGVAEARRVLDLGCIISLGGVVTYKNSRMAEVASFAPLESMMLETDAPYLTPVPHRGKVNEPAYVRFVCERVAELRGQTVADIERITDRTAKKFYRLVETFGE